MATLLKYPVGQKFFLARSSRYKHFCVLQFFQKIRKFKMATIFENLNGYSTEIAYGSNILSKSLYLARFSRYKHFCVLRKIQNGRHFWRDKIFLKIGMATLEKYPVGQKFRRNCSI